MMRYRNVARYVLVLLSILTIARFASAQRQVSLESGAKLFQAPDEKLCDVNQTGPLKPPFQLWQEVAEPFTGIESSISRKIIIPEQMDINFPNRSPEIPDRVFGLFFENLEKVLLVPTDAASGDPPEPAGKPCRYLVTGSDTKERSIYRNAYSTQIRNRVVAVGMGSILKVRDPRVRSPKFQPYVLVDFDSSCYIPQSREDEKKPDAGGVFYLEDAVGNTVAYPIDWQCDQRPKTADSGDMEDHEADGSGQEGDISEAPDDQLGGRIADQHSAEPALSPRRPSGFSSLGDLHQLQEIFNALVLPLNIPSVTALAFRCKDGTLSFWIGLDDTEDIPDPLPRSFQVLAAQMVEASHGCESPRSVSWRIDPSGQNLGGSELKTLSFDAAMEKLSAARWSDWYSRASGGFKRTTDKDIGALYQNLTQGRLDLPRLEDWKLDANGDPAATEITISLQTRGGRLETAREPLSLLCAYLTASAERCLEIRLVTCQAEDLSWSAQSKLPINGACDASQIYKSLKSVRKPGEHSQP